MKQTSAEVPTLEYTYLPSAHSEDRLNRALDLIIGLILADLEDPALTPQSPSRPESVR